MRHFIAAAVLLPLIGAVALAQAPGVIVPGPSQDKGAVIAPPVGPAADPNTITPGNGKMGLSEADARKAIEQAGYSAVMNLTQAADGTWSGMARKDQSAIHVVVDAQGKVVAD